MMIARIGTFVLHTYAINYLPSCDLTTSIKVMHFWTHAVLLLAIYDMSLHHISDTLMLKQKCHS